MTTMDETSMRPSMPKVRLGSTQLWVLLGSLGALGLIFTLIFWPVNAESDLLPHYESEFGFRGGRVAARDYRGVSVQLYALVSVDADGPLGLAGFRVGDVPVAHHGGVDEFAWALGRARCGEATRIAVTQASDWGQDRVLRALTIPASGRPRVSGCSE